MRQFTGAWYREVLRTQRVNLLGASPDPDRQTEAEVEALAEAAERADLLGKALARAWRGSHAPRSSSR